MCFLFDRSSSNTSSENGNRDASGSSSQIPDCNIEVIPNLAIEMENDKIKTKPQLNKFLKHPNCNINATLEDGRTALYIACDRLKHTLVKELLDQGADVNIVRKNHVNTTAIHAVCNVPNNCDKIKARIQMVTLLMGKCKDLIDLKNAYSLTPPYFAALHTCEELVECFLKYMDPDNKQNERVKLYNLLGVGQVFTHGNYNGAYEYFKKALEIREDHGPSSSKKRAYRTHRVKIK